MNGFTTVLLGNTWGGTFKAITGGAKRPTVSLPVHSVSMLGGLPFPDVPRTDGASRPPRRAAAQARSFVLARPDHCAWALEGEGGGIQAEGAVRAR